MTDNCRETIQLWSYIREYEEMREEVLATVDDVFRSGQLILGERVARFEREMAAYVQLTGGVGVNSGTDALHLGLVAAGIQRGDEVITVPNTAVPTVCAIVNCGALPVFVDVNQRDHLIDVDQIVDVITPRTRAILPVHLYGQCCAMERINEIAKRYGLFVLEDCAQSTGARRHGRPAGSMGDAGAFSFYPTKVLGGYGDGGWIGSNNTDYIMLLRSLRMYGMQGNYYSERHGFNSRLDEVQAALLSLKLPRLEGWINRRRDIAARYSEELQSTGLSLPFECSDNRHVYYCYVVEHPQRDLVLKRLAENNIYCNVSYPFPVHTMRGYTYLGYRQGQFPVAEAKVRRIFSLPMFPQLSDAEIDRVIDTLKRVV
jgi:aminotransferase EvaB